MFLDVLEKLLTTELLDCTSGSIWWVKGISLGCGQQYFTSVIGGSCFALEQAEAPLEHLLDGGRISRKRDGHLETCSHRQQNKERSQVFKGFLAFRV